MRKNLLNTTLTLLVLIVNFNLNAQTWLWAKTGDGPSANEGYAMTIDPNNNIFITGMFNGSTQTFGTYTLTKAGLQDYYLVKYDANGNVIWAKNSTCTGADGGMSISSDAAGNIYLTGTYFGSTMTLGTNTLSNAGGNDIFVTKMDNNGNVLWATSAGGVNNDLVHSIRTDAANNSYICGYFASPTIVFGTYTLTNTGNYSFYIVKYDPSGNVAWAKNTNDCNANVVSALAVAPGGIIYATGVFTSPTMVIGTHTLTNTGASDMFIVKYNTSGTALWAKNSNGISDEVGRAICSDANGNVYVTGNYTGSTFSYSSTVFTNSGATDAFVLKADASGNPVWGRNIGGSLIDAGYAINTYSSGLVAMGGYNSSSMVIGTTTLTGGSSDALYIAHYDLNGNSVGASMLTAGGDDQSDIVFDNFCNAYITGDIAGNCTIGTTSLVLTGVENVFTAKFSFNCVSDLGVKSEAKEISANVFPNPNNGRFYLELKHNETAEVKIYNVMGEKVFERTVNENDGKATIDISHQPKGMYFVEVISKGALQNSRIIIE